MKWFKKSEGALPKKKMSKKKKIVFAVLTIGVIALGAKFCGHGDAVGVFANDTTILSKEDFSSLISATGEVITDQNAGVYTTQTLPVKTVLVKESDNVQEGQVLAYLDDRTIKKQIRQKEAGLSTQAKNLAHQVAMAKGKYQTALDSVNNGNNAQLVSAEASLENAKAAWLAAEKTYNDYKKSVAEGYNPETSTQQSTLETARNTYQNAKKNYDQVKERYNDSQSQNSNASLDKKSYEKERSNLIFQRNQLQDELVRIDTERKMHNPPSPDLENLYNRTQNQLNEINRVLGEVESDYAKAKSEEESLGKSQLTRKQELESAELALRQAESNLKLVEGQNSNSSKTREDVLKTHRQSADTAKLAYETAKRNLEVARVQASSELRGLYDALRGSEISAQDKSGVVELAGLYQDLEDTVIRAPMSGTITQVFAKSGNAATGALFTIEDLDHLFVEVKLKTNDILKVKNGMAVRVKQDSNDAEYLNGRVVSIANSAYREDASPTPSSGSSSNSSGSSSKAPSFKVRIRVEAPKGKLLVGMKPRTEIVLKEEKAAFSVPPTAIIDNDNGKSILVMDEVGNNSYKLRSVAVTTGSENETMIAIEGSELKDGLQVLTAPDNYKAGDIVSIVETKGDSNV